MKPGTEAIVTAMQSGLSTVAAIADRLGCAPEDLRKPLYGIVERKLATRTTAGGTVAYKLTQAGEDWKPGQSGAALKAAMWKTSPGARA